MEPFGTEGLEPQSYFQTSRIYFYSKLETERHYQIRTRVPDLMDAKAMVLLVTENLMWRSGSDAMGGDEKMAIGRYEMEYN